jgi:SAM-dependent methyltransferase
VAAIHVLEHFYEWEAEPLLREWARILKPGGKMILELPCMDKVFAYIADAVKHGRGIQPFMTLDALYGDRKEHAVPMAHKFGWFGRDLMDLLKKIGMTDVKFLDPKYHFRFRDMRIEATK